MTVDPVPHLRHPRLLIGIAALFLHLFSPVFSAAPCAAAGRPESLKIGVLAPLSGPYAAGGTSFVQAATLAVEKANAEGGVSGRRVTIVVGDTQGRVDVAKSEALRLVSRERVSALVGAYLSEETVGVMEVAAAERMVRMSIERGRLADLLFDEGAGLGSRFLHHAVRALTALPVASRAMASEQVQSRFVKAVLAGFRG